MSAVQPELSISNELRSAVHLKEAIEHVHEVLKPIGYIPSLAANYVVENGLEDCFEEFGADEDEDKPPQKRKRSRKDLDGPKDRFGQKLLDQEGLKTLGKLGESFPPPFAAGYDFKQPIRLKLTRLGLTFDSENREKGEEKNRLKEWYESATVSGYGDVREQDTRVDPSIRAAREIPASEIEVEDELLRAAEKKWAESKFIPEKVRAEVYKIHLYAQGGHFKVHRDTPETDLVGTFLIGLGDTTHSYAFRIAKDPEGVNATIGSWVAFHPDVPHHVAPVEDGYRAVLALKLFRTEENNTDVSVDLNPIRTALESLKKPFGLLLQHEYCVGTKELDGFDAAILAATRSSSVLDYTVIPVVSKFEAGHQIADDAYGECSEVQSRVYPFTSSHIDIVLGRNVTTNANEDSEKMKKLAGLRNVPFFLLDEIDQSTVVWKSEKDEGAEYTGNESRPAHEDSIYLSFALVITEKL